MKKFILLFCFILCGCNGRYFQYQNNFSPAKKPPKFFLRNLEINFSEQKIKPPKKDSSESKYLTKDQIVLLTRREIINKLKADGVYAKSRKSANVLECDFEIEYVRKFMMFTNESYVGTVLNGYKIKIYKNGKLIAHRDDDDNVYFLTQGFSNNFNKLKKIFTFSYDEQDEKKEVEALARMLAENLERFGE
jgi:hypothetical protein